MGRIDETSRGELTKGRNVQLPV